jgi:hypothetical protein
MQELPRKRRRRTPVCWAARDDADLDEEVVVDEVGGVGAVGEDAADAGGGEEDVVGALTVEEAFDVGLALEVELGVGAEEEVVVAERLQAAVDRRAGEALVAGDIYFRVFIHTK